MSNLAYLSHVSPQLLRGLRITVEATLLGMSIALAFGLIIAMIRYRRVPLLSSFFTFYVVFLRNTPLLVQLYFLYYVLPYWGIRLNALLIGVIGLGLQFSAYTAEVYRGGFQAVPRGQWEAAAALNLDTKTTWRSVVIPQALRPIVPTLANYLISMFKDSAFLATITVYELLGTTQVLASQSFRYTLLFSILGLIYFAISYPASLLVRYLERRMVVA